MRRGLCQYNFVTTFGCHSCRFQSSWTGTHDKDRLHSIAERKTVAAQLVLVPD